MSRRAFTKTFSSARVMTDRRASVMRPSPNWSTSMPCLRPQGCSNSAARRASSLLGSRSHFRSYTHWVLGSPAAMKNALGVRRNIRFVLGALPCLPSLDSSIDLVVCSEVLEHLYRVDQLPSIEAIARVTKPGGLSIITTPNPLGIRSTLFLPIQGVRRAFKRNPGLQLIESVLKPSRIREMVRPWSMWKGRLPQAMPRRSQGGCHGASKSTFTPSPPILEGMRC